MDGTTIDAARVTLVDAGTLNVDLPQVPVGAHTLELRDGARVDSIAIDVVPSTEPRLQLGNGEPLDPWSNGQTTAVLASGPIGAPQVVLFSTSPLPSSIPILDLALGNAFTELDDLLIVAIPTTGYSETPLPLSGIGAPFDVYFQSVLLNATRPFPVSNLQSLRLTP